jgi:nucleotide-binding universal stress UspA family protein
MSTKKILVPLDGTALAEQALAHAQLLARVLGARIHLLRAISRAAQTTLLAESVGAPPAPAPAVCEQCTLTQLCAHTDCYLADLAQRLRAADVEADADMRVGAPAATIAELAQGAPEMLIAMGAHDERGLQRWVRGSLTDTLIHDTTAPLLLVPANGRAASASLKLTRILVPLDGSALARQALPIAIELAAHAQAELILLWVVAPSIDAYMRAFPTEADAHRALHDQAAEALAGFSTPLPAPPVRMTTAIGIGSPAQAIVEEAAWRHADLIVMATHGYIGLQRWRMGSVANTVLHATTTPLLLVRATHDPAASSSAA